jgi:NAD+ diphosphatase
MSLPLFRLRSKCERISCPLERRYLHLWRGQIVQNSSNWLASIMLPVSSSAELQPLYIASFDQQDIYLRVLDNATLMLPNQLWRPRQLLLDAKPAEAAVLARGLQLSHWLRNNRFCGRCAAQLYLNEAGMVLQCQQCEYEQYPRLSPCMIVLVRRDHRLLLAHNTKFPAGYYSAIAGFIEAGESVEQAVHREVHEEVGIQITDLQYHGSQSWAFPHSLMLGFSALYQSGVIQVDGKEITAANWFSIDNLPILPPKFSIARQLIDQLVSDIETNLR